MMHQDIDPITFQVIKNSLLSAAEEMKVVLAKTAYSPILKLAGDYSCGIFDASGNMVAQGPDIPIHLGSMPLSVKAILARANDIAPPATCSSTTTPISEALISPTSMSSPPSTSTTTCSSDSPASVPTGPT